MNGIYDRVVDIMVGQFDFDREEITEQTTFHELEMDSLFIVEFLVIVEKAFATKISDDLIGPADTIASAAHKIGEVVNAARSQS